MGSFGTILLKDIWRMLNVCAPGYTTKEGRHKWKVMWEGKTFSGLPKGKHGSKRPEIEIGHVRQLIRSFEIEDCAKGELEELG